MSRRPPTPRRSSPGQRQLRVGEQIRHVLVEILRENRLRDPVLANANLITVTAVEVGPDLKHAFAYVMPLGGKDLEIIIEALNRAAGFFRSEVAQRMDLRYTPKISFQEDKSFGQADHIETLLRQERVARDLERDEDEE